jgi:regulator of cell morphogenesis and NO signaling
MLTTETGIAETNPATLKVPALIDHILARYHAIHRQELPELIALAHKVERVHHDVADAPLGLASALEQLLTELNQHMRKEENILFPAMRRGAGNGILAPIAVMRDDHSAHIDAFAEIEAIARNFVIPEGACRSWQRLYAGASKLSDDLREHIHIENDILFPRFEVAAKPGCTCSQG